MGVSPSAKPSEVGFEEMYAYIKQGVAHPLPAFSSLVSSDGRLFEAGGDLYFMTTSGVKKRNGSSFATYITHSFNNSPEYWDVKPFFEVAGGGPNPTFVSATDQSITVSNTLEINMFVNRHVIISLGGVSQTMYITGNDEHTIYVDGLINGSIAQSGVTVNIYDKIDVLIVYDGDTVHRFKKSDGSAYGTADTFSNGFIEVFGNRLYLANTKQIKFSTFNSSTFNNNPFNTIDTDGLIIDKQIIGNALIFFTTHGTYALTGTGYTTMNFPKISEFSPQERVYPAVHMDNTYVIYNGYLRRLTLDGLQETEYNYAVIPDTTRKIYSTERGIIFPLGHATNKYGLLNVEELQNRRLITLTNFYDGDIDSLIEYKGVIFLVCGGVLYKQNGVRSISFKLNKIRFQTKLYRDTVEMGLGGTYPSSITAIVDDVSKTCLKNDGANQVSYNVRDMGYALQIQVDTTYPVYSFNIYYK